MYQAGSLQETPEVYYSGEEAECGSALSSRVLSGQQNYYQWTELVLPHPELQQSHFSASVRRCLLQSE